MKMKLELVPVPVTDVDRAKSFYVEQVGFQADLDVRPNDAVRIVQLTPPESACSIVIGTGLPGLAMQPGSLRGLHLVVGNVRAAREALISRASSTLPSATPMATPGPCKKCPGDLQSFNACFRAKRESDMLLYR